MTLRLQSAGELLTKFSASSVLPLPLYLATCGYGNNGRVRVTLPLSVPVLRHQLVRGRAFLDPADDRLHPADRRGAGAAEPVIDARREEQASKPPDLLPAAHPLQDTLVIIDGSIGRDELVGQAVRDDDLATPVAKSGQVRVVRPDDGSEFLDRLLPQELEPRRRERRPVPFRVLEQEVLEPFQWYGEGLSRRAANHPSRRARRGPCRAPGRTTGNFPSWPRGPSQIFRTTSASASVNVLSPTLVPTSSFGS